MLVEVFTKVSESKDKGGLQNDCSRENKLK